MDLASIAQRLEGAHKVHNGWRARCPLHDGERNDSLSLSEEHGKITVTCFAACDWRELRAYLGLDEKAPQDRAAPSLTYSYHDENGQVLYQVVRLPPKTFRQRRPHPTEPGQYVWNMKGVRRVLYHLPEVIAAVQQGNTVYLVEGEKDVETLRRLGLAATCNVGGAGKWEDSYSEALRGADVVILPDNDGPGRKHAALLERKLAGIVARVRTIELPGLPVAGDVSDWIMMYTVSDLHVIVSAATSKEGTESTSGPIPRLPASTYGDVFNAEALVLRYGHMLRYCREWDAWFIWQGSHWAKDREGEVYDYARNTLQSMLNIAFEQENDKLMKHIIKSRSHRGLANMLAQAGTMEPRVLPEHFDTHEHLFNCRNGAIDLRDGALLQHDPSLLITKCAPVDYNPGARCDNWQLFLWRIMGGGHASITPDDTEADMDRKESQAGQPALDMIGFLQRAVGYSLYGSNQEKVLLIPWGAGDNGKTTFIETLSDILGEGYARRTATSVFLAKREGTIPNDVAALFGIRFAYAAEPDQDRRLDAALIKELTGGDKVSARFMRGEFFEFRPACTIWMCTNHKPPTRDTGKGLWNRIKLIPFTVSIPEKEQDRNLRAKLVKESEGILAWAVQGCLDWQEGGLREPGAVTDATAEYRGENDTVGLFIEERCLVANELSSKSSHLYEHYKRYCEQAGERSLTNKSFSKALEEKGFSKRKSNGVLFEGIGVQPEPEPDDPRYG